MKNVNSSNRKTLKVSLSLILANCLLIIFSPAYAGNPAFREGESDPKINSLFLSAGISGYRETERTASPLIYSASLIPVMLGFNHQSTKCIWNSSMEIAIGSAWSSTYNMRTISVTSFDEDGNQSESIVELGKMSSSYFVIQGEYLLRTGNLAGGRLAWYNGVKLQEYLFGQGTLITVFMNQLSLNPKTCILYLVNKRISLASSLSFSLLALNTRLNYARDPYAPDEDYMRALFSETGFNTLNKFQRVDFSLSMQTRLSKHWLTSLGYNTYWFHHSQFKGIKLYENKLQITISRTF